MVIDCDTCAVRGPACGDCVVSVLLGHPGMPAPTPGGTTDAVDLDADQQRALGVLADAGMRLRLRLVHAETPGVRWVG